MLAANKKIAKETIKKLIKANKFISNIKVKFYCNLCAGKGYSIIDNNIAICNACSGTGLKFYT